ncbi:MAG: GNAT family N-acetyltransferase [Anaerolineae bacterium]|nr:GNAT family N-acetyltransferase [Anaerolineae bacterium]
MDIRRATVEDAALVATLNLAVHQVHVQARPDRFKPLAATDEFVALVRERLADEHTYVFIGEVDGAAVAYALVMHYQRPEDSFAYAVNFLNIDQMSVNPEYRSQGYGEQMMNHILDFARSLGIRRVTLNVWTFNERAIAFYERCGFKTYEHRMETLID